MISNANGRAELSRHATEAERREEEEEEVEEEEVEEVPLGDPATKSRYLNVINASWRILLKGV